MMASLVGNLPRLGSLFATLRVCEGSARPTETWQPSLEHGRMGGGAARILHEYELARQNPGPGTVRSSASGHESMVSLPSTRTSNQNGATIVAAPATSNAAPLQPADRSAAGRRLVSREGLLLGGVLVVALLLRLPYLWQVPRFTDELQEVLWSLAIYRGEILPLTAVDSYYGPLWSYLMAGSFLLDPSAQYLEYLPRIAATLLALVSVAVTYYVGRDMAGVRAGLIAAAFMATSGGHIIINSHTARSNSITPLISTLLVWAVWRATRSGDGRWLALAGFLFALALQTHLSAIAFAPGLALAVLVLRPRLLLTRWLPLAMVGFLVGYSNMLIWNLQNGFWSFVHARALQQGYTDGQSADVSSYTTNMGALFESLSRLVSGTIDEAGNPVALVYLALGLAGLGLLAWRGNAVPALFLLSTALVLPYFNPRYGPILSGRYIVPLLPFLYLGIALVVDALIQRLPAIRTARTADLRPALASGAMVLLVLFPLAPLVLYYREVLDDERTNAPLFLLSTAVERAYQPGDRVLVDESLAQEPLTAGGTDLKAIRMLLEADQIPYEVAKLSRSLLTADATAHPRVLVVMSTKKEDDMTRGLQVAAITPEVESASRSGRRYAVYALTQSGPAAGR
jgi:4-amino-4-deoxy-L-arabinose transferase-like glycosyltransferase